MCNDCRCFEGDRDNENKCRDHEHAAGGARPRDHPLSTAERARRWPAITNVPMPSRSRDPVQAGCPYPPEVPIAHLIEAVEIAGASDPEAEHDEQIFASQAAAPDGRRCCHANCRYDGESTRHVLPGEVPVRASRRGHEGVESR